MRRTISCLLITASTVLVWALLFSTHPRAQQPAGADPMVKRGEELYAQSCTAFCHGPGGAPGQQAPQLANRNFDEQYIATPTGRAATASDISMVLWPEAASFRVASTLVVFALPEGTR
jgi:mono/diheme cytochrome c family protein